MNITHDYYLNSVIIQEQANWFGRIVR